MEKKKYLFYWEEACDSYVPAPEKVENIIDTDNLDTYESQDIKFRIFEMTEQEYKDLPES